MPIVRVVVLCACTLAGVAHADGNGTGGSAWTWAFQLENDMFGDGYDRAYTHGMRLAAGRESQAWNAVQGVLPSWLSGVKTCAKSREEWGVGLSMYTPEDIQSTALRARDRPYAGWLFGDASLLCERDQGALPWIGSELDVLRLELGWVGPSNKVGEIQKWWHDDVITAPHPSGWHHQLNDELAFSVSSYRLWKSRPVRLGPLNLDLVPHAGAALGTLHTYAALGATLRLGTRAPDGFSPPLIRPSSPGSMFIESSAPNVYLFLGVEGRGVARNLFLDGNTFEDSHSVDKHTWIGDIQAGVVYQLGRVRLSYTNIWRSKEFDGQATGTAFGSFNVAVAFD
ncbi:MAG: lipid A deacylase LpxR family protein [Gammaproteobacteria bacterium]